VVRDSINDRELGQWSVLGSVGDCFFVPSVWVIIGPRTEASIHKRRIGLISCRYKYVMCEQTRGSTRVADTRSCFVIRRLLITIANRHGRVVTGANEICRSILRRTPVTPCIYLAKPIWDGDSKSEQARIADPRIIYRMSHMQNMHSPSAPQDTHKNLERMLMA
jgi:hypothetical protein